MVYYRVTPRGHSDALEYFLDDSSIPDCYRRVKHFRIKENALRWITAAQEKVNTEWTEGTWDYISYVLETLGQDDIVFEDDLK